MFGGLTLDESIDRSSELPYYYSVGFLGILDDLRRFFDKTIDFWKTLYYSSGQKEDDRGYSGRS